MRLRILLGIFCGFYSAWSMAADVPQVVVTLKPIHALVSGVMQGVGEPSLLLSGGESPHTYSLKPSQMKQLQQAQLIVWVGSAIESFLVKPLQTVPKEVRQLSLLEIQGLHLHKARQGGVWEEEHQHHADAATDKDHLDQHIWLDPRNAQLIVQAVLEQLQQLDPAHSKPYAENASRLNARLDALDKNLMQQLKPFRTVALMVFHDAYQYFEERYGLNVVGAISISPENRPSAKRLHQLRERIQSAQVRCVFSEPQFEPSLITPLIENTQVKRGVLDPNGMDLAVGSEAYFSLLTNLAKAVRTCVEN
jgi:zinc transport system substrate-binding protein